MTYRAVSAIVFFCAAAGAVHAATPVACASRYYPVQSGVIRVYRVTTTTEDGKGNETNKSQIEQSEQIVDIADDSFAVKTIADGSERVATWECTARGVRAQIAGVPQTSMTFEGMNYPANLGPGLRWTQVSRSKSAAWTTKSVVENRAGAEETIEVPAGKYSALKVSFVTTTTSVPPNFQPSVHGEQWFAPGVGLIKNITFVDFTWEGKKTISRIVTELTSVKR